SGLHNYFRIKRRLIRVIDTGKVLDLTPARLGIDALGVTEFAQFERRIDKNLDELITSHHVPHVIARGPVGAYRGAHGYSSMSHNFGRHKSDAPDIDVPIFLTEAQSSGKVRAHHVAIQQRRLTTSFQQ